ncbi:hypothetical protein CLOM_g10221 [Closterium sp. NIES-68]|nr:hypothetical protein CLOM_g10221 [Closterium sp. NIES-68]GJP64992.1 hypothetical protein CLOP_g21921 [Closterium sp. NIES-67]
MATLQNHPTPLDEYNKEMGELKTLVTKALEKKGVLARLKAELRASIFEVIDDKDKTATGDEQRAVRGGCSEQAKNLHDSKTGHLLTALLCEYLEWGEMDHTLKVYLSECNLPPVYPRRPKLEDELGLPSSNAIMTPGGATRPLLHELIDAYFTLKAQVKSGATGTSSSGGGLLSRATARSSSPSAGQRSPRSTSPLTRGFSSAFGRSSSGGGERERSSSGSRRSSSGGRAAVPEPASRGESDTERGGGGAFSKLPISLLRDIPSSRDRY